MSNGVEIPGPTVSRKAKRVLARKHDKLRRDIDKNSDRPMYAMQRIFEFVDLHNELIHKKHVVCKPGCWHCCRLAVGTTAIEAMYIGELISVDPVEYPGHNCDADEGRPCPFLQEDKTCKVYHRRPMACRNFFTYDDPKYCWPLGQDHKIVSVENGWGSEILMDLMAGLIRSSQGFIADIRDYFPEGVY